MRTLRISSSGMLSHRATSMEPQADAPLRPRAFLQCRHVTATPSSPPRSHGLRHPQRAPRHPTWLVLVISVRVPLAMRSRPRQFQSTR